MGRAPRPEPRPAAIDVPELQEKARRMSAETDHVQAMKDLAMRRAMRLVGKCWSALWD